MEADRQVDHEGKVWRTLRCLAKELECLGTPYAILGGIALQYHGVQRSTQDIDVLVRCNADLDKVRHALVGHGFSRKSPESRHLRDDVTRVRVEFLVAGEYPGDGQPKPVQFPDPQVVTEWSPEGLPFVNLKTLIELKLASARSAPQRLKDRADVLELIHLRALPAGFADQLDPYVRQDFLDLASLPPPSTED